MTDGFRGLVPAQSLLVREFESLALPANFSTGDLTQYGSIKFAIVYNGAAPSPIPDYARFQLLWRDDFGTLIDVDTFEVNSSLTPGFSSGNAAFVVVPVKGSTCQVISNAGSAAPPSPTADIRFYASYQSVPRSRFWQDAEDFDSTDLMVLRVDAADIGVLAPGVASAVFAGGLASGRARITFAANFSAVGVTARLRGRWGSEGEGPKDIVLASTGAGVTASTSEEILLPRRPVNYFVQNISPSGNINSAGFNLVREEL